MGADWGSKAGTGGSMRRQHCMGMAAYRDWDCGCSGRGSKAQANRCPGMGMPFCGELAANNRERGGSPTHLGGRGDAD